MGIQGWGLLKTGVQIKSTSRRREQSRENIRYALTVFYATGAQRLSCRFFPVDLDNMRASQNNAVIAGLEELSSV